MILSTNLPTSLSAYDALAGESGHKLSMNVSAEADAEFLAELRSKEPERFKRLERAMLTERLRQQRASEGRFCANETGGKHRLPADARKDALYCDGACKKAAYRQRHPKLAA